MQFAQKSKRRDASQRHIGHGDAHQTVNGQHVERGAIVQVGLLIFSAVRAEPAGRRGLRVELGEQHVGRRWKVSLQVRRIVWGRQQGANRSSAET